MSSKSSNRDERSLAIGRISGFRGRSGEITVRIVSGHAERWVELGRVRLGDSDGEGEATAEIEVEAARAYRDRLVLKLAGVDDADAAQALRGRWVLVPREAAPDLAADDYYVDELVGLVADTEAGERLGTVIDVIETGGTDLLVVEEPDGHEMLLPIAKEFVTRIRVDEGRLEVRLPDGLRELNRPENER